MQSLSEDSEFAYSSELNLFSTPPTSIGIHQIRTRIVNLDSALTQEGPWSFSIVKQHHPISLARTTIQIEARVTDLDNGVGIEVAEPVNGVVQAQPRRAAPVNWLAKALFRNIVLSLNGIPVVETGNLNPYRQFFINEFCREKDSKEFVLGKAAGYSAKDNGTESKTNPGYLERVEWVKDGKTLQLITGLDLGLEASNRLLLNGMDISLQLFKSPDNFIFVDFDEPGERWRLEIKSMQLRLAEAVCFDQTISAINRMLASGKLATYPYRQMVTKSFFVNTGTQLTQEYVCFSGNQVPRRIFVGIVNASALTGDYGKDPFRFHHFGLRNIYVDFCGITVPMRPYNLDHTSGQFLQAYHQMNESLGFHASGRTNGISPEMYSNSRAVYCIDLLPSSLDSTESEFQLALRGSCGLRLEFHRALTEAVQVVVAGEFNGLLTIDAQRQISVLPI